MASSPRRTVVCSVLPLLLLLAGAARAAGNFYQDVDITWGDGRGKIVGGGDVLTLSLDRASGSGFQSKNQYLYGRFDMQMKLVPGDSAGTVATFYVHADGIISLSLLPLLLDAGQGDLMHARRFYVDGTPIREHRNREAATGVAYPRSQAMRVYASVWDAEEWATQGGRVRTDWSRAPFVASYKGFAASGCASQDAAACARSNGAWMYQELDATALDRLQWVQKNYMIYNYCTDTSRFKDGAPPECATK
ncbi:unnamed protein product [Triticum turgidum subsp. durum]|uniref:Xyloglucan endotransglucosylase/hydrolase n=1 Tax=Triticum turgidum subsp. durum TaxID=4567 RepID=A0A9R0ZM17_TRITD|nr:unnamed protein product [Triticum turgidum subsp. durum]